MDIRVDDLTGPEIFALLSEHLADMHLNSPPESIHALDLTGLRQPEITFWTIWEGDQLAGCGALKELAATQGEIKSMRTAKTFRRQGVARQVLRHILDEGQRRHYQIVYLETGSIAYFEPAHKLYESFGFRRCEPFADYVADPNSLFMVKEL